MSFQEWGSVSDLKFTNEAKSTAFAKILFEPSRLQELTPLTETLQTKFTGVFKITAKKEDTSAVVPGSPQK